MPFYEKSGDGSEISFGSPQFYRDGFIYVYGTLLSKPEINRFMLLARVPEDHLMDFDQWEFYSELGMSEKIMMRTSLKPEGPWSEKKIVSTAINLSGSGLKSNIARIKLFLDRKIDSQVNNIAIG